MTLLPPYLAQTGYDQQGLPVLREAIARRYSERGLPTRPDEVMVVNGALSAFALILRLFTGPGDRVVIDAPTYPMAISAIQGASCRPVGVALPQQGWDCDGLAATIAQTAPRLAWLMPDFHNPTGRCMDALTRQRVADIAARTRTTLVIDETMADLWYNAPPPPPLASFNPDAAVLTIGSAGKSFWGDYVSAGSAPARGPSPRLFRPAIRWIWVRRCWSNWLAAGYWKMPPHCCRRGGICSRRAGTCAKR